MEYDPKNEKTYEIRDKDLKNEFGHVPEGLDRIIYEARFRQIKKKQQNNL